MSSAARITPAMIRLLQATSPRGVLPANANRATMRALAARDLLLIEHRRFHADRYRLTPLGMHTRTLTATPLTASQRAELAELCDSLAGLATTAVDTAIIINN